MTRMVQIDESDRTADSDEPPRSIFSAMWFRALVVVLVLGVVAAVAVPYVLDVLNPPPPPRPVTVARPPLPPAPPVTPPMAEAPPPAAALPAATPPPARPPEATAASPSALPPTQTTPPPAGPPKPAAPPKPKEVAKPAEKPKAADPSMPAAAPKPAAKAAEQAPAPERKAAADTGGPYWVQVGAFRDEAAARRLAARLRAENFPVAQSEKPPADASRGRPASTATGADRYHVFVSGLAAAELSARLGAKGLAAEPAADGVVVKPSLTLRDAVTLSKDLAAAGLKVQVRRATGEAEAPGAADEALHRVRVGGFPSRAAAEVAAKELAAKGYQGFIARSDR